jgi:serine/threonine protein kinase/dipeptidyl aminopeptidase/acylaminoacyl peptidase
MEPERWQQIETLYHAALERAPMERAAFLAEACVGDSALRHEVEELLRADGASWSFIEGNALVAEARQLEASDLSTPKAQLLAGQKLGAYKILAPLGKGGMGEVYRAIDPRLDRQVAIKVLPAGFAQDGERLKRFEQEARATSALNHPNILTVHDIGQYNGAPYIVAELLEGEELRAPLKQGALPLRQALDYAQQCAAGLAAAHEKGVVHRDLKPENLFVTKDGRVKILDFGLAKLKPRPLSDGVDSESPTQKSPESLTASGAVLGTVAYMSPEQVRGEAVDHRSDLFSFGLILFEMLSGERAFKRESLAETMTAILKDDVPELGETNAKISPQLEKIVRRCLEKRPERRFQSASDLSFALEAISTPSGSRLEPAALPAVTESLPGAGKASLFGNTRLAWIAAAALLLVSLLSLPFAVKYLRRSPPAAALPISFTVAAPSGSRSIDPPEISPDGRNLLYAAMISGKAQLWLRPLGSSQAQPLPGTEDVGPLYAWSPDSRSICFASRGQLRRLELAGGQPETVCDLTEGGAGASWGRTGVILFTNRKGIHGVPATGGEAASVFRTDQPDAIYRWPVFLPDGRHFLYLGATKPEEVLGIYLASLDGKETRRLLAADTIAHYAAAGDAAAGHLVFGRGGALLAAPFDAGSLKLTGEPFPIANEVQSFVGGRALFSVSGNGTLVYVPGGLVGLFQLTWVDRAGKLLGTLGEPGVLPHPILSPDGKQVAVVREDSRTRTQDVYVIDVARGAHSRLSFDSGDDVYPIWSPDSSRVAWRANRDGAWQLYQRLASGLGPEELLLKSDVAFAPSSWSPDDRYIIYHQGLPKTKNDLWLLPLAGDRKPLLFLQTPFMEHQGKFSPDGAYVAYVSNDQGRIEVNVQPFPASGGKWQISTNGGNHPHWRGDGKELYFVSLDDKLMAAEVRSGSRFEAGAPKALCDLAPLAPYRGAGFSVTPDGQRFLFITEGRKAATSQYTVVVNWMAEMKK